MPSLAPINSSVPPTLIVVLGMHRSGTSVLTRAMETLGADLGSKLLPAEPGNNDKGFFEDIDINRINIEVMQAAGFDWDTMAPIDLSGIDANHLDQLQVKAATLLREKSDGKVFALKDPRIARLLPFCNQSSQACRPVSSMRSPCAIRSALHGRLPSATVSPRKRLIRSGQPIQSPR
ncbi:hypothetical protein BTK97_003366 [Burkholderia multivorans]|nr:hypothetical protein [Burkholderia multivorans]